MPGNNLDPHSPIDELRLRKLHAHFETGMFRTESDDLELDERPLGENLAHWIGSKLESDCTVGDPISEDWGWALPIAIDGKNLWLMLQKWLSTERGWHVWIERRGLLSHFLKQRSSVVTLRACEALDRILASEHQVSGLQWFSSPEDLE
jgi:hypothetical protein